MKQDLQGHLNDDELTLVYFQEAEPAHREHVTACAQCAAGYARLSQFLDAVRAVPLPERPEGWEQKVWTRLAPQVTATLERRKGAWFRMWMLAPAMAALVAFAFLAGMYTQHRFTGDAGVAGAASKSFSPESRKRVLLIALGDHLDRSQIVLAELVNAPEGKGADISAERQLAGSLVSENRLLRQTAAHSGDNGDAQLLEQLERVLVAIAHSPADISARDLADLQQRIEAPGLLFKVRVLSSNARSESARGNSVQQQSQEKGTRL